MKQAFNLAKAEQGRQASPKRMVSFGLMPKRRRPFSPLRAFFETRFPFRCWLLQALYAIAGASGPGSSAG
jgi:hypothetical protein